MAQGTGTYTILSNVIKGTSGSSNIPIRVNGSGSIYTILSGRTDSGRVIDIPVTSEGHMEVAVHGPRLPFGSVHTENLNVIFQTDAIYGLNSGQVDWGSTLSGNAYASQSMFSISTGTTLYSEAYIQSRKRLRYRPGQGVVGRFTALYTTPTQSSYQVVGFGHAEDGIYVGYSGSSFGILHVSFGVREQQLLTLASASSTNESATVVLNGISSSISITNSGNINRTAYELSIGTYSGWKAEPTGAAVLFTADSAGIKNGSFSLIGSTSIGTFSRVQAGANTTESFVSQSDWNGNKLNGTGDSGVALNPLRGNVYEIGIQYLGFGPIVVKAEVNPDSNNPDFITLHTFDFPNNRLVPTFGNPSFPFSMAVYSAGSNADLVAKCSSFAGFVEGNKKLSGNRFAFRNTVTSVSTTLYTELFTIMNSRRFGDRTNQSVSNILSFAYACKLSANATGEFYVIKNGTLVGNPVFLRYDTTSCMLIDTTATSVTFDTNDKLIFSLPVGETVSGIHQFEDEVTLQPGEIITVAMKLYSGTATFAAASLNTREDQ